MNTMQRLRGEPSRRPQVDPGLAPGLRDLLEDGLAHATGALSDAVVVRVHKQAVTQVLRCEAHRQAISSQPFEMSNEVALGSLVDAVFRQLVTTGRCTDPLTDALAALAVAGDPDGVERFVAAMSSSARRQLAKELTAHAAVIAQHWSLPSPAWMARTQERCSISLAGGAVVVSGVLDLAFGSPASDRASVCLVEIKSGRRRVEHRHDLHLYALLETLRSGAPPFQVATFYTATGELDVEPVGEEILFQSANRLLEAARRLCRLAAGQEPERSPNPLCSWCPALSECEAGAAFVANSPPSPSP